MQMMQGLMHLVIQMIQPYLIEWILQFFWQNFKDAKTKRLYDSAGVGAEHSKSAHTTGRDNPAGICFWHQAVAWTVFKQN